MGKDKLTNDDWSFPPSKPETLFSLYVDGDGMPTQPLEKPSSPPAPKADTPVSTSKGRGQVGRSKDKPASALNKPPPPPSKVRKRGKSKTKPPTFTPQQRRDILKKARNIRRGKE
jgi:hypothetical protein